MLRALSPGVVQTLTYRHERILSVAQAFDGLGLRVLRFRPKELLFAEVQSRYSFFDRAKLFIELILSRKETGHLIIFFAVFGFLFFLAIITGAGFLGLISLVSQSTIIALIVAFFGTFNLLAIGAAQVSSGLMMDSLHSPERNER